MPRLIGAEFFKLKKRWMPYVLLLVLLVFTLLPMLISYFSYQNWEAMSSKNFPDGGITTAPPESGGGLDIIIINGPGATGGEQPNVVMDNPYKESLVLPTSMDNIFASISGLGPFLIVVLAASLLGTEYGWGTLRQVLAKGISRPRYLSVKFITLAIVAVAGVIIAVLVGYLASIITTLMVNGGVSFDFLSVDYVGSVFASMGRILIVMGIYLSLAVFFTVLFRSSMAGIAVAIAFIIVEPGIIALLSNSTEFFADIASYTIGFNARELLFLNMLNPRDDLTSWWRPAGILLAYGTAFIAASYYFFRRQDLTA